MNREERLKADGFEGVEPVLFYRSKTLGSNFSPHPVKMICPWSGDLVYYSTCEHRYQAMKATNQADHDYVVAAVTAFASKERGREITLRDDWGEKRSATCWLVMLEIVMAKTAQHPAVKNWLKSTGDRPIYEDSPKDDIWGWQCDGDYRGRNLLGQCWMETRKCL